MAPRQTSDSHLSLTMALLWEAPKKAGWSGLSSRGIVEAAVALADKAGLDAVSMRRIAETLGVGTMSLYAHVPGKTDLLSLMVDAVLGELYQHKDEAREAAADWRGRLEHVARANWDLWDRHPWLLEVSGARPVLGPHACLKYEAELRCLEGAGFSDLEMDSVLTLVLTHVEGTARAWAAARAAEASTGRDDKAWWAEAGPLLEQYSDTEGYPVSSRVGLAVGELFQTATNPAHIFQFGLERILEGAALLLRR